MAAVKAVATNIGLSFASNTRIETEVHTIVVKELLQHSHCNVKECLVYLAMCAMNLPHSD